MTEHSRPAGHDDLTFDVSPDGRTIVFTGAGKGGRDLYLLDLDSRRVTPLTSSDDYEVCPSFSRDGRAIAFTRGRPGVRADQLCVMDLATRKIEQITNADENVSSPVFLPDGRIVCTVENDYRWGGLASSWNEGGELRIIDVRSRRQVRLKTSSNPVFRPRVSADGKWVGWIAGEAFLAPVANPLAAKSVMPHAEGLAFSPHSDRMAVTAGAYAPDLKLYLTDQKRNNPKVISGSASGCFDPVFSPDGRYVYFLAGLGVKTLMRCKTDETGETLVSRL